MGRLLGESSDLIVLQELMAMTQQAAVPTSAACCVSTGTAVCGSDPWRLIDANSSLPSHRDENCIETRFI